MLNQVVELKREVSGIQIPSGDRIILPEGSRVYITQTLGNSYTVATDSGLMRISKDDGDALGMDEETSPSSSGGLDENASLEDRIWDSLGCIYDPEIPVDIVNLGLIYDIIVTPLENGLNHVAVKMTLTAPGCGMGPHLMDEAKARVEAIDGVEEADVEMIWDPPWNQDMVSEEGRMKLGLM